MHVVAKALGSGKPAAGQAGQQAPGKNSIRSSLPSWHRKAGQAGNLWDIDNDLLAEQMLTKQLPMTGNEDAVLGENNRLSNTALAEATTGDEVVFNLR